MAAHVITVKNRIPTALKHGIEIGRNPTFSPGFSPYAAGEQHLSDLQRLMTNVDTIHKQGYYGEPTVLDAELLNEINENSNLIKPLCLFKPQDEIHSSRYHIYIYACGVFLGEGRGGG